MPCTDGGVPYATNSAKLLAERDAMLCAALTWMERAGFLGRFFAECDLDEAGIEMPNLASWWAEHKARDRQRRKEEKSAEDRRRRRDAALKKLTPEEIRLLRLG